MILSQLDFTNQYSSDSYYIGNLIKSHSGHFFLILRNSQNRLFRHPNFGFVEQTKIARSKFGLEMAPIGYLRANSELHGNTLDGNVY